MKISLNWLSDFVELSDLSADQVSDLLTNTGLEVEGVESYSSISGGLKGLVVAEVLECEQHPNADRLKLTTLGIGTEETYSVVCGAPNVFKGQKVILAPIGTSLNPSGSDSFTIKKTKIRGELSEGMICAEDEIGLGHGHDGIIVLGNDAVPGTPAADVLNVYTDTVFEIGITPNRSDALSHIGTARDLAVVLNRPLKRASLNANLELTEDKKVEIVLESPEDCPRYSGLTMTGIKLGSSPDLIVNRLKAVGAKPINNVVDATNYAMLELGHPLHAFDLNKVEGNRIVVKRCGNEKLKFLDGVERQLNSNDLGIYNENKLMALGGVMGGEDDSISEKSQDIFIESAYFNPVTIRKSSKQHNLKTDAAFRFERGTYPGFTILALKRAAQLIAESAGGKVSSALLDNYPVTIKPTVVELSKALLEKYAGSKLPEAEVLRILEGLDFEITNNSKEIWKLSVPMYRVDVTRPVDVIEEILRIYGYNHLIDSGELRYQKGYPLRTAKYGKRTKTALWLASKGFNEIKSMSLVPSSYLETAGFGDRGIEVLNPLSEELNRMRPDLLSGGLQAIARNQNRQISDLRLFEFGSLHGGANDKYFEEQRLALWLSGQVRPESWMEEVQELSLMHLKGIASAILNANGINKIGLKEGQKNGLSTCLMLKSGKEILGHIGSVNKAILNYFGINNPIHFASLAWDKIENRKPQRIVYQEPSKFPSVERDLALLVPKEVKFEKVEEVINQVCSRLLQNMSVFDIYQGKGIPENTSSVAVKIILQDKDKTLKDEKVDSIINRIIDKLDSEFNIRLR